MEEHAERVRQAAQRLAETPGALLVRIEPVARTGDCLSRIGRPRWNCVMTSAQIATAPLDLPAGSDRISVTALGAFEPTRPTDTPATLLAELNRERKAAGFDSLPRETRVASLGFDDLGFLSFQISAEVAEFDCVEPLEHAALLR